MVDLSIDAEQTATEIKQFIEARIADAGAAGAVLGLSGGLDSATVAFLAAAALGPDRVWPLFLPYRTSSPASAAHAQLVADTLRLSLATLDITRQVDAYFDAAGEPTPVRRGNKAARERMSILYDQAKGRGALVLGTGNRTEGLLGYTTLWGDMACDLAPIGDLYKTQVRQLAAFLGVSPEIISKPPTADLWPDQTDESELGISYEKADELLHLIVDRRLPQKNIIALGYARPEVEHVARLLRSSEHKRRLPPCPSRADD